MTKPAEIIRDNKDIDINYFFTWDNWKNILLQSSTVAIVALGQAIILLTGNFDLSLGRNVCLASCVGALLMKGQVITNIAWNPWLAAIAMISVIAGIGGGVIFTPLMLAFTTCQGACMRARRCVNKATQPLPRRRPG